MRVLFLFIFIFSTNYCFCQLAVTDPGATTMLAKIMGQNYASQTAAYKKEAWEKLHWTEKLTTLRNTFKNAVETKQKIADQIATAKANFEFVKSLAKNEKKILAITESQTQVLKDFWNWRGVWNGTQGNVNMGFQNFYYTLTDMFRDSNGQLNLTSGLTKQTNAETLMRLTEQMNRSLYILINQDNNAERQAEYYRELANNHTKIAMVLSAKYNMVIFSKTGKKALDMVGIQSNLFTGKVRKGTTKSTSIEKQVSAGDIVNNANNSENAKDSEGTSQREIANYYTDKDLEEMMDQIVSHMRQADEYMNKANTFYSIAFQSRVDAPMTAWTIALTKRDIAVREWQRKEARNQQYSVRSYSGSQISNSSVTNPISRRRAF